MINNRNCEGTEQLQIIFVPEERGEDYENQIVQNSAYIMYTGLLCDACRMWLWKETPEPEQVDSAAVTTNGDVTMVNIYAAENPGVTTSTDSTADSGNTDNSENTDDSSSTDDSENISESDSSDQDDNSEDSYDYEDQGDNSEE